jgi:hypothetical protein
MLRYWFEPPRPPREPHSSPLANEMREAQQKVASSARIVQMRSAQNKKVAEEVTETMRKRVEARDCALDAASGVFRVLEGGKDDKK